MVLTRSGNLVSFGKSAVASIKPGLVKGNGSLPTDADFEEVKRNYRQMGYAEICQRLGIPQ